MRFLSASIPLRCPGLLCFLWCLAGAAPLAAQTAPIRLAPPPAPMDDDAETEAAAVSRISPNAGDAPQTVEPEREHRDEPRHPDLQVLLIMSWSYPGAEAKLRELEAADGPFERLRRQGWKVGLDPHANLRIVSVDQVRELVDRLGIHTFPNVCSLHDGEVIRSFTSGCTTPLDEHTFVWLRTGVGTRPATAPRPAAAVTTTGRYPLRGGHWSVDGDWSPSLDKLLHHLRGSNHNSLIPAGWAIEAWSYEELRSLHDDLHESNRPRSLESGGRALANSVGGEPLPQYFSATSVVGNYTPGYGTTNYTAPRTSSSSYYRGGSTRNITSGGSASSRGARTFGNPAHYVP